MISPRNRTDHVPAPVLFRLPHLHAGDVANPVEQLPQQTTVVHAEHVAESQPMADHRETAPVATPQSSLQPTLQSAAVSQPQPVGVRFKALGGALLARREVLAKPPVMLAAMLVVAFGSWIAGRQTSTGPAIDVAVADASAATSSGDEPPNHGAIDLNAPHQAQPSDAAPVQRPALPKDSDELAAVANVVDDFYIPEDEPTPELAPASTAQTADKLAADAVASEPPASPTSTIALQTATEEIPATIDPAERFAGLSTDILNQPTEAAEVAAAEPAAPPEVEPEPVAEAPEATQLASTEPAAEPATEPAVPEAEATPPAGTTEGKTLRRILSRTPHDIPDWTKYLTGANSPIKAASAPGYQSDGAAQPKNEQAYYYEQD